MLGLVLLALASAVGLSQASGFTEKGLSLLSYQLCSYLQTRSVQRMEAVQTSHVTHASCGGWIPWRRCPKTVYRTQYLAVEVPESRNVTDCCQGYEQLGLYCVLPLNRSGEFASRPGVCPTAAPQPGASQCSWDTDCPGLQKCCPWSGGHHCVASAPHGRTREAVGSWYNVTVLVKMDFEDLQRVDPRLRNHTRLLYSLVTSALQPLDPAVHYLSSASQDPSTTLSWLLLGLPRLLPVANVSALLDDIVKRVYEVVNIQVQDVNECAHHELHACPGEQLCVNAEGSYQCVRPHVSSASAPRTPNPAGEDCPPICDYVALNVTSSSFRVSWSLNSTQNHTFHVQVQQGELVLRDTWTSDLVLEVAGLEAGVLYSVKTSYQGCGTNVSAWLTIKTDAQVYGVTIKIINRNLTEQLLNCSSTEHRNFSRQLLREVENSFPPAVSDLYRRGKLRVQITSLQAGSLVVKLRLTVQDPEFPVAVSTLAPMLQLLSSSTVFQIDQQGTVVQDWDECADGSQHDCSPSARCINLEGSYACQCHTARDANPSRAGRACEGDVASPTGGEPSAAAEVTAPALGTETPTLSLSPRHPWDSLAASQAQTPGPPPRRGGSITVRIHRNSTGRGMEEELLGSPTVEPLSWPGPAERPPGHVVWHTSLPPQGTSLSATRLQSENPAPSPSPDLPSTPIPASLKGPACVPVPIERVTVSNVTSSSFHLAWVANLTLHPTFRLTLVSPWSPAQDLETQDTGVTLSGLGPGTLHLVEIVAEACGKGGAGAHLKVRTAAQKLRGRVRLANAGLSESSCHAGGTQHFLRVVGDSLPATLRQHMDSGGIRVDVTSIAKGGGVVEFDLLVMVDLDVREVSATFLSALQNASLLEGSRGGASIWDYDECERQEHDCVPGTSCQNTLGSFTCRCQGGALDSRVEYSGRRCEGGSPGNLTQAPSPERPPTPVGTKAALMPGSARPAPQDLHPRLNLTGAVRVLCEIEKVAIAIRRRFLQQEAIPESSLYLGQPSCNVSSSNSTHVLLVASWGECGTLVQSNLTNTVVRTVLRSDLSPEGIIHHLKILSPIHCTFRNDLLTSLGYGPEWGVHTVLEDLHGAGNFVTKMQLFVGDSPIPQNHSVSASDDVKIQVGLFRQNSQLKVVLTECWATPSSNAGDPLTFGFINNSCPVPNTYTSVIENGNSSKAQFKLRVFSFINNSVVYLHCRLRVCVESPRATCRITCHDSRLRRSSEGSVVHQMSWGPLVRSQGAAACAKPGLGTSYLILIAVAGFAVVAGVAAFLITRYHRLTGQRTSKSSWTTSATRCSLKRRPGDLEVTAGQALAGAWRSVPVLG
ncbi:uromodulin-like 1 [Sciurus carolinensis]|uniref:uromodulin-like 1 n=1 Tax=Sciurus carolinensis TaxID=30640 RepID=UPI001FB2BD5F|nr:uromodulin-like 1 [Sciurus carolinensis]